MFATLHRGSLALIAAALLAGLVPAVAHAELRLYMFEQVGCVYCKQWNEEVGDAYDKTDEGRLAPLVRVNIREALPADLTVTTPPHFTPTFVLASDGREIGRIEGYPGEDFFWSLLGQMLALTEEARSATATN
jgi:thioredoxin-related protein